MFKPVAYSWAVLESGFARQIRDVVLLPAEKPVQEFVGLFSSWLSKQTQRGAALFFGRFSNRRNDGPH